jgi:CSLREA domain-containing protein
MLNFNWLDSLRNRVVRKRQRKSLLAFSERLEKRSMLTSFVVTSTEDAPDADPGDGAALTATGETTLRSAIEEANASPGADTIEIPAGYYDLPPGPEPSPGIEITDDLTIRGAGRRQTTFLARKNADEIFAVDSDVTLLLNELSLLSSGHGILTEGRQPGGGVIELENFGQIDLVESERVGFPEVVSLTPAEIYLIDLARSEFEEEASAASDEDTAFPVQSAEPIRTNSRHDELLDELFGQRQIGRPIQQPLIEAPLLELPDGLAPISKPDILLESRRQELMQQLDESDSNPSDLQLTQEESPDLNGERTAKNEREAADDPTSRRENVINSLFEKKGDDASREIIPASGETPDSEATPAPARLPLSPVPLTEDGELLLKPARKKSRPAPPPLPEPAEDGSANAADVSVHPAAAAAMAVVPFGWKQRLRKRLRYWQAVVS